SPPHCGVTIDNHRAASLVTAPFQNVERGDVRHHVVTVCGDPGFGTELLLKAERILDSGFAAERDPKLVPEFPRLDRIGVSLAAWVPCRAPALDSLLPAFGGSGSTRCVFHALRWRRWNSEIERGESENSAHLRPHQRLWGKRIFLKSARQHLALAAASIKM